jgi:catalase
MLQLRLFSHADARRDRLEVNHHEIPVNAPKYFQSHISAVWQSYASSGARLPGRRHEWRCKANDAMMQ